jgi:hypothetical protein
VDDAEVVTKARDNGPHEVTGPGCDAVHQATGFDACERAAA